MLAYYTSLIKREELLEKLAEDGESLSSAANDLVCELKSFVASCSSKDVESALIKIKEADELVKVVGAMITNLKGNYESYVGALIPKQEQVQQAERKDLVEETFRQNQIEPSQSESNQMSTLLEAIKTLKGFKESMDK